MSKVKTDIPFTKEEVAKTPKFKGVGEVKPPQGSKLNAKPTPEKKAKATKEPKEDKEYSDAHKKITVLNKENPHKADSNRAKAFVHMLKSKTVGDYTAGGATCKHKYLAKWAEKGSIKLD